VNTKLKIAILYFSRSTQAEADHKYWGKSIVHSQRMRIASLLSKRVQKTLKIIGLPIFNIDETLQSGASFGERLANAYQSIFDQGYEGVIAVGNDCLELNKVDWSGVMDNLQNGMTSIGPDLRNGSYLIACTKDQFDKNTFANLQWQKEGLLEDLKNIFCEAKLLPELADFNEKADLKYLLRLKPNNIRFLLLLIRIFNNKIVNKAISNFKILIQLELSSQHSLRAPPTIGLAM